jgi:hypothetical protein
MDKHQRKQLARWEQKKAKDERKFQAKLIQHTRQNDWLKVETFIREYEPPMSVLFPLARKFAEEEEEIPAFMSERTLFLLELWDAPMWDVPLMPGMRSRVPVYTQDINVSEEIAARKQRRDEIHAMLLAYTLRRHQTRVDAIREELLVKTTRIRAIQTCRHGFKEELMMAVWHPRRVERILETYGWEALDNLLGVE